MRPGSSDRRMSAGAGRPASRAAFMAASRASVRNVEPSMRSTYRSCPCARTRPIRLLHPAPAAVPRADRPRAGRAPHPENADPRAPANDATPATPAAPGSCLGSPPRARYARGLSTEADPEHGHHASRCREAHPPSRLVDHGVPRPHRGVRGLGLGLIVLTVLAIADPAFLYRDAKTALKAAGATVVLLIAGYQFFTMGAAMGQLPRFGIRMKWPMRGHRWAGRIALVLAAVIAFFCMTDIDAAQPADGRDPRDLRSNGVHRHRDQARAAEVASDRRVRRRAVARPVRSHRLRRDLGDLGPRLLHRHPLTGQARCLANVSPTTRESTNTM